MLARRLYLADTASTNLKPAAVHPVGAVMPRICLDRGEHGLFEDQPLTACEDPMANHPAVRALRDLVYELASVPDRDLGVDVMIHATGIAEFGRTTLATYARRHGLSVEGFRKQVLAMQARLGIVVPTLNGS